MDDTRNEHDVKNGRDSKGRFTRGNPYAARGGRARAQALSPQRRREIARLGFAALVETRFDGDSDMARGWLGSVGAWAGDVYRGTPWQRFQHPGGIDDYRRQWAARRIHAED
ncbi:MAG: hypothetical protein J5I90_06420 [Caldilineales bacterium]|nr:hypothetical protein [Caldilineales bacterium]